MKASPVSRVAERLPHLGEVALLDALEPARRLERTLEEACSIDVRVDGARVLTRGSSVRPGLFESLGLQEMQREHLRVLLGRRPAEALDRLADAAVQLETAPVGETFVGGVADERMTEMGDPGAVPRDEVPEALPDAVVERITVSFERRSQKILLEGRAEHRGAAQHRPVARGEPVDLDGEQCLDGIRQRFDAD